MKKFMTSVAVVIAMMCCGNAHARSHSADIDADGNVSFEELLRVVQLYNANALHCDVAGEDGYAIGVGGHNCAPHDSDFNHDWRIGLSELLRLIQLYSQGYWGGSLNTEDGFKAGKAPLKPTISFPNDLTPSADGTIELTLANYDEHAQGNLWFIWDNILDMATIDGPGGENIAPQAYEKVRASLASLVSTDERRLIIPAIQGNEDKTLLITILWQLVDHDPTTRRVCAPCVDIPYPLTDENISILLDVDQVDRDWKNLLPGSEGESEGAVEGSIEGQTEGEVPLIDLKLISLNAPATVLVGDEIQIVAVGVVNGAPLTSCAGLCNGSRSFQDFVFTQNLPSISPTPTSEDPLLPGDSFTITSVGHFTSVGHKSLSLTVDPSGEVSESDETNNSANTSVLVEAEVIGFSLTTVSAGNGQIVKMPNAARYDDGANVKVAAIADPGWKFSRWEGHTASETANPTTIVLHADQTVTAVFVEDGTEGENEGASEGEPTGAASLQLWDIPVMGDSLGSIQVKVNNFTPDLRVVLYSHVNIGSTTNPDWKYMVWVSKPSASSPMVTPNSGGFAVIQTVQDINVPNGDRDRFATEFYIALVKANTVITGCDANSSETQCPELPQFEALDVIDFVRQ